MKTPVADLHPATEEGASMKKTLTRRLALLSAAAAVALAAVGPVQGISPLRD